MPNKVIFNGEVYFVIDMYTYGRSNQIKYLLDNGKWVKAELCEIAD